MMATFTTKDNQIFKDDQPWFYFADTCWSAFTNINLSDWCAYLDKRQQQGFNAVQIDILRQWDASSSAQSFEPFAVSSRTADRYNYNYDQLNLDYFKHAGELLDEVIKRHMTPVLVLLWGNYVAETWMHQADFVTVPNNTMTLAQIKNYVQYATTYFKAYDPIYFVSGDVDFPTDPQQVNSIVTAYDQVLKTAKSVDSKSLYGFHINGENDHLPKVFLDQVDFFTYQSGHGAPGQATAYQIPRAMRAKGFTGPMFNAEPCYEAMPEMGAATPSRFNAKAVRQASWSSVLAGANAGITYGAHGIWSWHVTGANHIYGNGTMMPLDWHQALTLPGAQDVSLMVQLVSKVFAKPLQPLATVFPENPAIIAAETQLNGESLTVLYVPANVCLDLTPLKLAVIHSVRVLDLSTRTIYQPTMTGNQLNIMASQADSLVLIKA